MKGRLMYVPKEIAASLGHVQDANDRNVNTIKGRIADFSAVSMLKILSQLQAGSRTFSDLYARSGIRYKRSYIQYLHLCTDYGFIQRKKMPPNVHYCMTDKGRNLLALFADGPVRHN